MAINEAAASLGSATGLRFFIGVLHPRDMWNINAWNSNAMPGFQMLLMQAMVAGSQHSILHVTSWGRLFRSQLLFPPLIYLLPPGLRLGQICYRRNNLSRCGGLEI